MWSQRSTNVPAIGERNRFGRVGGDERERRPRPPSSVDAEHEATRASCVDPVAEERDELARPERRERAVEREADVRVLADPLADDLGSLAPGSSTRDGDARPPRLPAQDERPLERGHPANAGDMAGPTEAGRPERDPRGLLVVEVADAHDAREQEEARPSVRNTSPIEATFWISGNGIGMTSASGPRWSRKSRRASAGRIVWIAGETSAGGEARRRSRLGSQIGM